MSKPVVLIGWFALLLEVLATAQIVLFSVTQPALVVLGIGVGASLTAYISENTDE